MRYVLPAWQLAGYCPLKAFGPPARSMIDAQDLDGISAVFGSVFHQESQTFFWPRKELRGVYLLSPSAPMYIHSIYVEENAP